MSHRARNDDRDRRGGRADRDRERERVREARPARGSLNEFFVDGKGIHREVLQREICKYLGPEAHSRPSSLNGVDGYIIKAVRPFTQEMMDDLEELSAAYVSENREMRRMGRQDISYGESETSRRQDLRQDGGDPYIQERYQPSSSYTTAGPQSVAPGFPSSQSGHPGSSYPPGTVFAQGAYPSASGYSIQGYPALARPGTNEATYAYASEEYASSSDPYRQGGGYQVPGGSREVRLDPRDPRAYSGRDTRMDPRDHRPDPRADPRAFPSYVTSGDIPMAGVRGDERYEYIGTGPPPQSSGRGFAPPSRAMATAGFDPRHSPGLRETYRTEPLREERRRR